MTDPEDPAAKNEQELNLFSDQPLPMGESPAEPETGENAGLGDIPAEHYSVPQDNVVTEQPEPENVAIENVPVNDTSVQESAVPEPASAEPVVPEPATEKPALSRSARHRISARRTCGVSAVVFRIGLRCTA